MGVCETGKDSKSKQLAEKNVAGINRQDVCARENVSELLIDIERQFHVVFHALALFMLMSHEQRTPLPVLTAVVLH